MFLVHENFKDVFVEVLKTEFHGENFEKLRVRWWNLGFCGSPWIIENYDLIYIFDLNKHQWNSFNPNKPWTHPGRN